ncbi:MAG: hypothetical protein ACOYK1_01245 [Vampirovibrionia bacterium]
MNSGNNENDNNPNSDTNSKRRRLSDIPLLTNKTKEEMATKINYFKTMPPQVRSNAQDIESPIRTLLEENCTYGEITSTVNRGRISIIKLNQKQNKPI